MIGEPCPHLRIRGTCYDCLREEAETLRARVAELEARLGLSYCSECFDKGMDWWLEAR